jgi:CheY-like chemotaxis protein
MTRQLLAFNRKRDVEMRPVDVCELLRAVAPVINRLVGDDVTVRSELCQGSVWVWADQGQLEQVVMNLTVNARDAMPSGGTLKLACERVDGGNEFVVLSVTDTGEGMDEETSRHVFEPLFTTKEAGTGLGLATVSDVVKRHGGKLRFTSELGRGTSFEIVLPQSPVEKRTSGFSEKPGALETGRRRVLLVEDEPHVRRSSTRLIESMGHEVIDVANGAEALSLVESGAQFDVIVSDVQMPVMTGLELARRLLAVSGPPPLVLVSGHLGEPPSELNGMPHVVAFLIKPFSYAELKTVISDAVANQAH